MTDDDQRPERLGPNDRGAEPLDERAAWVRDGVERVTGADETTEVRWRDPAPRSTDEPSTEEGIERLRRRMREAADYERAVPPEQGPGDYAGRPEPGFLRRHPEPGYAAQERGEAPGDDPEGLDFAEELIREDMAAEGYVPAGTVADDPTEAAELEREPLGAVDPEDDLMAEAIYVASLVEPYGLVPWEALGDHSRDAFRRQARRVRELLGSATAATVEPQRVVLGFGTAAVADEVLSTLRRWRDRREVREVLGHEVGELVERIERDGE